MISISLRSIRNVIRQFFVTKTPDSLVVAGQHVCFPTWHGTQLVLTLHVLKERHDAPHLGNNSRLQPACPIILDQALQPIVAPVPALRTRTYRHACSASSDTIQSLTGVSRFFDPPASMVPYPPLSGQGVLPDLESINRSVWRPRSHEGRLRGTGA